VRDTGIKISGKICCKSVQRLAYADSIVIVGQMLPTMKEALELLDKAA
jgi:hypothetical protein